MPLNTTTMAEIHDEFQGATIASAATTDLAAATGDYVTISGTTTITALGTVSAGVEITLRFSGALTFTHNSTSLILPGGGNITTASGDCAIMRSEGSGNWRCVGYTTASRGIAAAGGFTASPCGQIHTGGYPAIASTSGSELTPGATTTAYICEIFIPCNMTITGVNHFNGSAVTGNITVGLYTAAGVAIGAALSAATAGSGTDAYQAIPFATPYAAIGPAKYLIAFLYSSTSARPNCHAVGTLFSLSQASFTVGTTAISPLPTAFNTVTAPMASLY